MRLRALIFDVDGTLADTEEAHREAFNRAFEEARLGWHWSVQQYRALLNVTGGKERLVYFMEHAAPDLPAPERWPLAIRLHARKTEHYAATIHAGRVPLRPGVRQLLAEAQAQGVPLAIATTTTRENVTALLEATLGTPNGPFKVIVAGDDVPQKKPAPDVYQAVLRYLNLRGRSCLAIEDSEIGLRAAQDAGIPTVITSNAYTAHQDFAGAAHVMDDLTRCAADGNSLLLRLAELWEQAKKAPLHTTLPSSA